MPHVGPDAAQQFDVRVLYQRRSLAAAVPVPCAELACWARLRPLDGHDRFDEKKRYREITAAVANTLGVRHRHVPLLGIALARGTVDGVKVRVIGTSAVTAGSSLDHGGLQHSPAAVHVSTRHRAPGSKFRVGGLRRGRIDSPEPGDVLVIKGSPRWMDDVGVEAAALITQLVADFPGATVSNTRVKAQAVRASNQQAVALCRAMIRVSASLDAASSADR